MKKAIFGAFFWAVLSPLFCQGAEGGGLKIKHELRAHLNELIKASGGNRTAGSAGAERAEKWLKAQVQGLKGWELSEQIFDPDVDFAVASFKSDFSRVQNMNHGDRKYVWAKDVTEKLVAFSETRRGKKGRNLILRKKGSDPSLGKSPLIVSAHFDTIINTPIWDFKILPEAEAPGADDNGTAVVAALRLAIELNSLKVKRPLEIVFFDYEEEFFLGSRAYAKELARLGMKPELVNLEMIGWDKPEPEMMKVYCRSSGHPGGARDLELAKRLTQHLAKEGLTALAMCNNFDRSDHWSFWQEGFNAVTVTQDWERDFNRDNYHSSRDRSESIDWAYAAQIYRGVKNAVVELVN